MENKLNLVKSVLFFIIISFCNLFSFAYASENEVAKRIVQFDNDWKFYLGDSVPTQNSQKLWQTVALPHDWSIELPFSENTPGKQAVGYKNGGTGWYRKNFTLSYNDRNKLVSLYFEGIYMGSEIWINGKKAGFHPYGYTTFKIDITPYCNFDEKENEILVKVVNFGKNSRWYAGSGIYRHVKLIKTNKIHLDSWNTFISTEKLDEKDAIIKISTEILGKTNTEFERSILIKIFNEKGAKILQKQIKSDNSENVLSTTLRIQKPHLWTINNPKLYSAKLYSIVNHKSTDSITIPFGIRTLRFSTEKGFQLNGNTLKLRGGCIHHDNGLLGSAAIDRAEEKKVELLKSYGYNAVRCSHNPPSEKFLQACDSLGMLVIDEAFDQWQREKNPDDYHLYFDEWSKSDIESMVRRDRNHPSVIMWSIGNEIQERADLSGLDIAEKLKQYIKNLDNNRPITSAVNDTWDNPDKKWKDMDSAFKKLDVGGYNYMYWEYEDDHKRHPERIIYGSESTPMESAINWDYVQNNPYIIGDFLWTAIDYLGEAGVANTGYFDKEETKFPQFMQYPWFNAWCGDIDLCGNMKSQYLFRKVVFNDSKIEMLVHAPIPQGKKEHISYWGWPDEIKSWNWNGNEGKPLEVRAFSKCEEVDLYLNGKFIERKKISKEFKTKYTASFQVTYQPGNLKAVALQNGRTVDSTQIETTGKATAIRLKADRKSISASTNDLAYISVELIDEDGNVVLNEDRILHITQIGDAEITAGNANPTDTKSFRSLSPTTFRGRALIIVRPKGKTGAINLSVNGEKINSGEITISLH